MNNRKQPIYNGPIFDAHDACVFFVDGQVHVGSSDSRWSFLVLRQEVSE